MGLEVAGRADGGGGVVIARADHQPEARLGLQGRAEIGLIVKVVERAADAAGRRPSPAEGLGREGAVLGHRPGHLELAGHVGVEARLDHVGDLAERIDGTGAGGGGRAGVAGVVHPQHLALVLEQLADEIDLGDDQVVGQVVVGADAGEGLELAGDGLALGGRQVLALHERRQILIHSKGIGVVDEGRDGLAAGVGAAVIGGDGGQGGDVGRERDRVAGTLAGLDHIHRLAHEDDAVERGGLGQLTGHHRRADRAVTFAQHVLRRGLAAVGLEPGLDEAGDRLGVAVDLVEVGALGGRLDAGEAGLGRVDEHQVGDVEQGVGVVHNLVGLGNFGVHVLRRGDPARAEGAHVQPGRGRAGAAVEQEDHRPRSLVLQAVAHIGGGDEADRRLAGGVAQHGLADAGDVLHLLAVEGPDVAGHEALGGGRLGGRSRLGVGLRGGRAEEGEGEGGRLQSHAGGLRSGFYRQVKQRRSHYLADVGRWPRLARRLYARTRWSRAWPMRPCLARGWKLSKTAMRKRQLSAWGISYSAPLQEPD